ncbi:MAG TPA: DUF2934 domain-containing protein [Burkholderiales bacterium]|nr:DUF2934 domain-containing protein [Burkholderiales bacterium]
MAKGKERPTATPKTGGSGNPGSKPEPAPRSARSAPDAPATRPPAGGIAVRTSGSRAPRLSPEEVYKLIQESAYFKAKARGFAPGREVQDWIEAEAEVRLRLEGRAA